MSYTPSLPSITMLIDRVLRADHPRLRRMRWSAVSVNRKAVCPGPAWVVVTSPAVRAVGTADVIIHLDASVWNEADDDTRLAWIDFVLSGLVVKERNGSILVDGSGRPIIKKIKPPIIVSLWPEVVARHGRNAFAPKVIDAALSLAVQAGCWTAETETRATRQKTTRRPSSKPHPDFKRPPATAVIR